MVAVLDDELVDSVVADRYRIVRKLGEGGMCAVYEAKHIKLARSFALKRLLPQLTTNAEAVSRFEREGELLASLRHINVVDIVDWVTLQDGSPCMVLEFLHGAELAVRLQRVGPMPWDAIARIGDQVMSALSLAHRNGITHRDLKPENIFISIDDSGDERVKLLDFGVSKLKGVDRLSSANLILGTPSYMSPEQAAGQTDLVGPSTDVWAMGAILYEMATNRTAFTGEHFSETLDKIKNTTPDPLQQYRKDASLGFIDLVESALSRDPARRIHTIEDLRARLRTALEPKNVYRINTPVAGTPVLTRPTSPPSTAPVTPTPTPFPPVVMPAPIAVVAPERNLRPYWIAGAIALVVTLGNLALLLMT